MNGPIPSVSWRVPGSSGSPNEPWGVGTYDDAAGGQAGILASINRIASLPIVPILLTALAGVTAVGDFPDIGTGLVDSAASGTITFPTGVVRNPNGLAVLITDGTGAGQIRRLFGSTQTSSKWTSTIYDGRGVAKPWSVTPTGGTTHFELGIWCQDFTNLHLKSEASAQPGAADTGPRVFPIFFGAPVDITNNSGALMLPPAWIGEGRTLTFETYTARTSNGSSYVHGKMESWQTLGFPLAKIRLDTVPQGGIATAFQGCAS